MSVWFVKIVFFFFKQKTAYEIKECDWSSDVCSSDLFRLLPHGIFELPAIFISLGLGLRFGMFIFQKEKEIGRASCRERV